MTSEDHRAVRPRPPARLTRRGRVLLVLIALGAMLFAFWLGTWQAGIAATADVGGATYDRVVLEPGDTLWKIAKRRAPGVDPRVTVHRIMEANDMSHASVYAGQRLRVPVGG